MAERRMFALKIIDSDAFLDMPDSAQNLYFHLSMRADDDGFISNPKKVMRMIGASDDNLKILLSKRFLLSFDTGIVVIKHWRLHNYIAKDRYTETIYKEEKNRLFVKANGAYTDHPELVDNSYTPCIQSSDTGKVSKEKEREGERREDEPFSLAESLNPNQKSGEATFQELKTAWNAAGLPKCTIASTLNMTTDEREKWTAARQRIDDLPRAVGAIKTYGEICASIDHEPDPGGYQLLGFLLKGVESYVAEVDPWTKCKKKGVEGDDAWFRNARERLEEMRK
jgi:hypothetical protein